MSENKYTPEPWRTDAECGFPKYIHDSKGNLFLRCGSDFDNEIYGEANARRIVACVNACAGMTNEQLDNICMISGSLLNRFGEQMHYLGQVEQQREAGIGAADIGHQARP